MSGDLNSTLSEVDGVVKWFSHIKGFGFLIGPEGQDVFIHFSVIEGKGFRSLEDGDPVRYDAVRSEKGWKATRVVKTKAPDVTVTVKKTYSRSPRQ